jgi:hypothetical protein
MAENKPIEQPITVWFIGFWLIASQSGQIVGLFGLLATIDLDYSGAMANWSSPRIAFAAVNALLRTMCGIGILRGWPWSRILYAATAPAMMLVFRSVSEMRPDQTDRALQLQLVSYLVFLFLLFRPRANAWFAAKAWQLRRSPHAMEPDEGEIAA